jgi:UPF0755 protein
MLKSNLNPTETFKNFCCLFKNKNNIFIGILILVSTCSVVWIYLTSAPSKLMLPTSFEIESGSSLREVSQSLHDAGIIKSRTILNTIVILGAGDAKVVSGEYLFEKSPTVFEVAKRITLGDFGIDVKEVRFPEGVTNEEIALIMESRFPYFDKNAFMQLASDSEGMLFPDTYLFLENVKAHEVYKVLTETFEKKIVELKPLLKENGRSLHEVINIASIVEKEATAESRAEVASIIWKRLEDDMPLQVDATFVYSIGKGTFDLTKSDLQDKDNPYNSYTHKGLPPTPISNPGLESLVAAASALPGEYLFFLTGHDGEMYYAKDFEQHKKNRSKYLY